MDKISVIIPCYNEQEAIPIFYDAITKTAEELSQVEMEFLFVNDGSKDGSFAEMKRLAENLSADMAHLRVDLYEVEGKVYFGELTFYDSSGMAFFDPPEWDEKIGSWLKLPEKE